MSDPKRLSSGDDFGATLLASALVDQPRAGSRARAAAALGLAVGAAASAATIASSGTASAAGASIAPKAIGASTSLGAKAATALWLKLLGAGVVTVAVAGGVAVQARRSAEHSDTTAMEQSAKGATGATGAIGGPVGPRSNPLAPPPVTPPPETTVAPAIAEAPIAEAPVAEIPKAEAPKPTPQARPAATGATGTSSGTSGSTESPLARELRSLDGARSALARGDASGALVELDRHDRAFPAGSLRTEAKVLRAEALLARGDRASARRLAKELLARDPSSPHAQRLRTIADAP